MNKLLQIDRQLFQVINARWSNDFLDCLLPFLRNSHFWYPLYLFLLLFAFANIPKNKGWWLFFAAGTVILSNFISSDLIKENIFRIRPCNDAGLADNIRVLVTYRPQSSSFTSSHAVNHFALAAFFSGTLKKYMGNWVYLFFAWAMAICYAQVYVGVHFPLDVICGGLIGLVLGYLPARAYNNNYQQV